MRVFFFFLSWPVHSTCVNAHEANKYSGVAFFIPVLRILFFLTSGRKCLIPAQLRNGNMAFSASM